MKLSKQDCENILDALAEYDEQICPKELADGEVGLNAERLDDLVKRLKQEKGRAEALPAKTDESIWVLDASSGIVFKVEIPANFPENGDYEDFLEANLPNDIRLKDCNWMVGGVDAVTIHRDRYHLGF
jgi:hypothetical protein